MRPSRRTTELRRDLTYVYRVKTSEGEQTSFAVRLHPQTLAIVPRRRDEYPEWTALGYRQCSNCPLSEAAYARCPVASNVIHIMDEFGTRASNERVHVEVVHAQRTYASQTTLQAALRSLLGVVMVTSGCPVTDPLRPLVRIHLPFANNDETFIRAISIYLMGQYVRERRGFEPDWELAKLPAVYEEIRIVNRAFFKRVSGAGDVNDAVLNAIGQLDIFAGLTSHESMREHMMERVETLFAAYLTEDDLNRT